MSPPLDPRPRNFQPFDFAWLLSWSWFRWIWKYTPYLNLHQSVGTCPSSQVDPIGLLHTCMFVCVYWEFSTEQGALSNNHWWEPCGSTFDPFPTHYFMWNASRPNLTPIRTMLTVGCNIKTFLPLILGCPYLDHLGSLVASYQPWPFPSLLLLFFQVGSTVTQEVRRHFCLGELSPYVRVTAWPTYDQVYNY